MKEQIEQIYIDALNNDLPPNLFAQCILNLMGWKKIKEKYPVIYKQLELWAHENARTSTIPPNMEEITLIDIFDFFTDGKQYEPYFGWCDVEGCRNEGCSGGNVWRETGYWTVCSRHSAMYRNGKKQPKMKQDAINREKKRDKKTGYLL